MARCDRCRGWNTIGLHRCQWCGTPLYAQGSEEADRAAFCRQVLAVVGNSAVVLLAARLVVSPEEGWQFLVMGLLPVAVFAAATGQHLFQRRDEELDETRAGGLFSLLGTAVFALAGALGLLVFKGARAFGLPEMLQTLAPLLTLAAIPILSTGLAIMRGTVHRAELAAFRTAGTAVALFAGMAIWIGRNPWDPAAGPDYRDPRSVQAYGIGLGLLTLAWLVVPVQARVVILAVLSVSVLAAAGLLVVVAGSDREDRDD